MDRRAFLTGLGALGLCPLCLNRGFAAEGAHWSYEGDTGPANWGSLGAENAVCSAGSQQSPVNVVGATKADLPALEVSWPKQGGTIVNNGHTIQVNISGGTLAAARDGYELVQYHFHAPSEHLVDGKRFPMEVHFVHKARQGNGLGVLGVLMSEGKPNAAFAKLMDAMPKEAGKEVPAPAGADPNAFLPRSLAYWKYEGSLTTPPCSEVVDWMLLTQPVEVAKADIAKFTGLYPMNARPAQTVNRRFILRSG